ncbi:Glucose-methanol-choline oxidoreductase [Penicillium occitanis (nom. inval.)]|nr:Glucose-methanol-choline oxidoreductase [Penicillium occitanis (nom. inval.)]PCH06680.1 hypothetical protein PENOC_023160 [Penicillium occitanis (nom. inval.)]
MLLLRLAFATLLLRVTKSQNADSYDFIIVGGGTAGLAVANRLSEMPDITVAVIETGDSVFHNHNVTQVTGYGLSFGTAIDWAYETENQTYAGGSKQIMRAGKAIGGTSTINGKFPSRRRHDAFADFSHSLLPVLDETLSGLGVPYNRDVNDGSMVGLTSHPDTIDRDANIRHDAARAYYWPFEDRPNLKIISNTHANKIIWAEGSQSEAIAIGVEVTGVDGPEVIRASKEVILSAGSLRSPLLLELSGIGNPDILKKFDIPVKVNISTVGENLQDQTNNELSFDGRESWVGSPTFSVLPSVDHIYGHNVSSIASLVNSSLADYAKAVSNFSNGAVLEANIQAAFQVQYDLVFKDRVPYAEIVFIPIAHSFMSEYWTLLPFSRGSVHMASSDPSHPPSINPNYFMFAQDLNSQADVARYIRKIFSASPLSSLVGDEFAPGLDLLPKDAPASKYTSWVKATYRSNFHPVGTASMLPREKGGVVNPDLKVYGTENVRVVDASVFPFQVCGHLTSTIYAVAERASDIIRKKYT